MNVIAENDRVLGGLIDDPRLPGSVMVDPSLLYAKLCHLLLLEEHQARLDTKVGLFGTELKEKLDKRDAERLQRGAFEFFYGAPTPPPSPCNSLYTVRDTILSRRKTTYEQNFGESMTFDVGWSEVEEHEDFIMTEWSLRGGLCCSWREAEGVNVYGPS